MNLKIAILAASLVGKRWQWTSSHFKVETKDSAIALSRAEPALPIDGSILASSSFLPNESEVYWADSTGRSNTPSFGGVGWATRGLEFNDDWPGTDPFAGTSGREPRSSR
jgi:hypothetical protein